MTDSVTLKVHGFESQILFFNGMYNLPVPAYPSPYLQIEHERKQFPEKLDDKDGEVCIINRLENFKNILIEEVDEVEDIIQSLVHGLRVRKGVLVEPGEPYEVIDLLVDLADWLGDIQVFCASEMARYGLPIKEVLSIIMASNFSKLGADGKPIYDARGKVQKGPGYWKPEPQIKALLEEKIAEYKEMKEKTEATKNEIVWRG